MNKLEYHNNPSGLYKTDTLGDAIRRADQLAEPNGSSYSGMLTTNKDLRRIVLLTREYRKLAQFIRPSKPILPNPNSDPKIIGE